MDILQAIFKDGSLPTECTWQTVVLIPKGGGNFRCIGLVGFLWKMLSGVINRQIRSGVQFQDVLHGFRAVQVTGTASLEAKLLPDRVQDSHEEQEF